MLHTIGRRPESRFARPTPKGIGQPGVTRRPEVIDVSQPRKTNRTAGEVLASVAGAVGLALLAPLAILAVGVPIAVAVRVLLEVIVWMF